MLALGWSLSPMRHTVANYLWRAGACAVKHFTRYYAFLTAVYGGRGPLFEKLDWLWVSVITLAVRFVPEEEPIRVRFDETTYKKTGPSSRWNIGVDGCDRYRNGAGRAGSQPVARQEYRTLWGLHFVIGEMLIRMAPWPDEFVSVPIPLWISGWLALYVKEEKAEALGVDYYRRSELARQMLDRLCGVIGPQRVVFSVQDGNYSGPCPAQTQYFLKDLPKQVHIIGRFPKNAAVTSRSVLYGAPEPKPTSRPGPQASKGTRLGSPEAMAEQDTGWHPHPREAGAEVRLVRGLWHAVLPGVMLQVVLVRRRRFKQARTKRQRQRYLEAVFTTHLSLSLEQILQEYDGRWIGPRIGPFEITISAARQSLGLGQDRCRRYAQLVSINALRLIWCGAEVLWVAEQVESLGTEADGGLTLGRDRPKSALVPSEAGTESA
jgi:hypothetical protein